MTFVSGIKLKGIRVIFTDDPDDPDRCSVRVSLMFHNTGDVPLRFELDDGYCEIGGLNRTDSPPLLADDGCASNRDNERS